MQIMMKKDGQMQNIVVILMKKKLSRAEKERDKNKISCSYQVACFDLQAALRPIHTIGTVAVRSRSDHGQVKY
jgi:hypothetical protein